jgi:hypothetical protein
LAFSRGCWQDADPAAPANLMAAPVVVDSLVVPAVGRQYESKKDSMPSYSFGTGTREAARIKVYQGSKAEKSKSVMVSPGPVYAQPSSIGNAAKFSFGTDENRKSAKAKYPDSSVDLTCSLVDSQHVKYRRDPTMVFGTEPRMSAKNGELLRMNPLAGYATESPGALEYYPDKAEPKVHKAEPCYSFGQPIEEKKGGPPPKMPQRMKPLNLSSTPRHVGPGSHRQVAGIGPQPLSSRSSAPQWSFSNSPRDPPRDDGKQQLLTISPELSSMGKQVASKRSTMPICKFGSSTRDGMARTQIAMTELDRGPVANMSKPHFSMNLPAPILRLPPKAGM